MLKVLGLSGVSLVWRSASASCFVGVMVLPVCTLLSSFLPPLSSLSHTPVLHLTQFSLPYWPWMLKTASKHLSPEHTLYMNAAHWRGTSVCGCCGNKEFWTRYNTGLYKEMQVMLHKKYLFMVLLRMNSGVPMLAAGGSLVVRQQTLARWQLGESAVAGVWNVSRFGSHWFNLEHCVYNKLIICFM